MAQRTPHPVQGQHCSHRCNDAPRLGARIRTPSCNACGSAQHTNTNNAPSVQRWEEGCGTSASEDTSGTPSPAIGAPEGHTHAHGRVLYTRRRWGGRAPRSLNSGERSSG